MYAINILVATTEHRYINDIESFGSPLLGHFFGEVFSLTREDNVVRFGDVEGVEERRVLVVEPGSIKAGHSVWIGMCPVA